LGEPSKPTGQEDCLYLNVHVPETGSNEPKAVLVWIHGGGYFAGSGVSYDPYHAMDGYDVIVVTINYR